MPIDSFGLIGEICDEYFTAYLSAGSPRHILICSTGGDLHVGRALFDLFNARGVEATATGACSSSALLAFMGARRRYCTPSTVFLWHRPWIHLEGPTEMADISHHHESMARDYEWMCTIMEKQTAKPRAEWARLGLGKGTEFDAMAALEAGVVSQIIGTVVTGPGSLPQSSQEPQGER